MFYEKNESLWNFPDSTGDEVAVINAWRQSGVFKSVLDLVEADLNFTSVRTIRKDSDWGYPPTSRRGKS